MGVFVGAQQGGPNNRKSVVVVFSRGTGRSLGMGRVAVVGAAFVMSSGLLAGCSGSVSLGGSTLDEKKLSETITADLNEAFGDELKVTVACPADVKLETGGKSECTAKLGAQELVYDVVQNNDEGDVTYTQRMAIISLDKAQTVVAGQVGEQLGGTWTLDCQPAGAERHYVIAVDGTFTCDVSGTDKDGDDQAGQVEMTVKDLEGNVDWTTK